MPTEPKVFGEVSKEEIEKRQPWQSFIETTFNIHRRMADHHFLKAESWEELVDEHDRWLANYNAQRHWAHERREDGRRSPAEVLGPVTLVRHHPKASGARSSLAGSPAGWILSGTRA